MEDAEYEGRLVRDVLRARYWLREEDSLTPNLL